MNNEGLKQCLIVRNNSAARDVGLYSNRIISIFYIAMQIEKLNEKVTLVKNDFVFSDCYDLNNNFIWNNNNNNLRNDQDVIVLKDVNHNLDRDNNNNRCRYNANDHIQDHHQHFNTLVGEFHR